MKGNRTARANLVEYMGTARRGAQRARRPSAEPSTDKQNELIKQLEQTIPDFKNYFEYELHQKSDCGERHALITAAMGITLTFSAQRKPC